MIKNHLFSIHSLWFIFCNFSDIIIVIIDLICYFLFILMKMVYLNWRSDFNYLYWIWVSILYSKSSIQSNWFMFNGWRRGNWLL